METKPTNTDAELDLEKFDPSLDLNPPQAHSVTETAYDIAHSYPLDGVNIRDLTRRIQTLIDTRVAEAFKRGEEAGRREELESFNPFFTGDHSKCPDGSTCIGYQNAVSDYENERELRLAALDRQEGK